VNESTANERVDQNKKKTILVIPHVLPDDPGNAAKLWLSVVFGEVPGTGFR
jgi:hypothetical protein